jgi:diaminohydroxyphosphoribosylaminopyrimidine deaminase / 5-amino-6-(5-phosphoribosylamino)uracil reductase
VRQTVSLSDHDDRHWMRLALADAEKGAGFAEPNPLVGAVVVRDGELVACAHHERFGGPHAEVLALDRAGDLARGATLYVTLEPCCHFGKTPPCTRAVIASGIARVVAAMVDPYAKVSGGGLAELEAAGILVEVGCEGEPARELNAPYLKRLFTGLPFVTAKWAMTLDGKAAAASGDSRWISSEPSRRLVHELRARMDGIVTGIDTVLADDPRLTSRIPDPPRRPVRIILDSAARLPLDCLLARSARDTPVVVAVTARADSERVDRLVQLGCEIIAFPGDGQVPIIPLLEELGRRGMTHVLVEGGGRVQGSFFDQGQVDAFDIFIAPIFEGGDHCRTPVRGRGHEFMRNAIRAGRVELTKTGDDFRMRGRVPQPWREQAGWADP